MKSKRISAMHPAFNDAMHDQYLNARAGGGDYCDWLTFIGSPNLYDGGVFVNRTAEEQARADAQKYRRRVPS